MSEQKSKYDSASQTLKQVGTTQQRSTSVEFLVSQGFPSSFVLKFGKKFPRVPRTIEFIVTDQEVKGPFPARCHGFLCHPPGYGVPALLHTNRDARGTARKEYKLLSNDVVVYFDVALDTFSFDSHTTANHINSSQCWFGKGVHNQIERIVLPS